MVYTPGDTLASGPIIVTTRPGAAINNLVLGSLYVVESTGGPWHAPGGSYNNLQFEAGGTVLYRENADTNTIDTTPSGSGQTFHNRVYFTADATSASVSVSDGAGPFTDNTGALNVELRRASSSVFCEYGTQALDPAYRLKTMGLDVIQILASEFGAPLVVQLLIPLVGYTIDLDALCPNAPPEFPALTEADFLFGDTNFPGPSAWGKAFEWLQAAAWHHFCGCVPAPPGSPAPTPHHPDVGILPRGDGVGVNLVCDADDLCSIINLLALQLGGISRQVQYLRSDVTLIQRQKVPFSYLLGATHIGLTGNGTLAVQGILGLSVDVTAAPGYLGSDMDPTAPSTYFYGSLNLGNPEGWQRKVKLTHDPHLLLEIEATITAVEYELPAGVEITITELVREP